MKTPKSTEVEARTAESGVYLNAQEQTVHEGNAHANTADFPSLDLAYGYVQPAYDWAVQRSDRMEERLHRAIAGISILTLAMPTIGVSLEEGRDPLSPWFLLALVAYAGALIVNLRGQTGGGLRLPDPTVFFQKWLHKAPEGFKNDMVYFAGKDLHDNIRVINARYRALRVTYWLAAVEILFWVLWVVVG